MELKRLAYTNLHNGGKNFVDYVIINGSQCIFSGASDSGTSTINAAESIVALICREEKRNDLTFFDLQTYLGYSHYQKGEYDFNQLTVPIPFNMAKRWDYKMDWRPLPCPQEVLDIFRESIGGEPRRIGGDDAG